MLLPISSTPPRDRTIVAKAASISRDDEAFRLSMLRPSSRRRINIPRFDFEIRRVYWIVQRGNRGWRRHQLMQQLQALWLQSCHRKAHAGDIAAGAAEACHETGYDRIAAADEYNRYGRGGSPGRAHGDI